METDLYCINCNRDLLEDEGVVLKDVGTVERGYGGFHIAVGDMPYLAYCEECGDKLVIPVKQRPNRVVVELYKHSTIKAVRAECPDEVVVIIKDYYDLETVYGPGHEPISKLNTVDDSELWQNGN